MKKKQLKVPLGIKYLSDWPELWNELPRNQPFILNKRVCGCGATEMYIRSDKKVILASPRKQLLYNKYSQHLEDGFHLYRFLGDKKRYFESASSSSADTMAYSDNLTNYINSGGTKILTTYDSIGKIMEILKKEGHDLSEWIVVIDEFQAIFSDCQFKATTEYELYECLNNFPSVIYLSATPFLERYLALTKQFGELTIYELLWSTEISQSPNVEVVRAKKSTMEQCGSLIKSYKAGDGRSTEIDGKEFRSSEAVFYINSVAEIKRVIEKNGLKQDEVCVICSSKSENIKTLEEIGIKVDTVPGKGESHKMFTFCTSAAYIGADFYSTNAYSYIFANPQIGSMTVDVSVDLQQILGRQRLDSNPFRNSATLYFNTKKKIVTLSEMHELVKSKDEQTTRQIANFNAAPHKTEMIKLLESTVKRSGHKDNYCCIVKDSGGNIKLVKNDLLQASDLRAWELANLIYRNDFSMYQALSSDMSITKAVDTNNPEVQKFFEEWIKDRVFSRKAKLYCELKKNSPELVEACSSFIERRFRDYYDALGENEMANLGWREDRIKSVLYPIDQPRLPRLEIAKKLMTQLSEGQEYTATKIRDLFVSIYQELGIKRIPGVSDLNNYMTCSKITTWKEGKKIKLYKIISHQRKRISKLTKITDTKNLTDTDIDIELGLIGKNRELKRLIKNVRSAKTPDTVKMKLPAVMWNGLFKTRTKKDLLCYSSYVALDYDKIDTSVMLQLLRHIESFSCVYAYFITPSGNGVKVIVQHDNYEPEYHTELYEELIKEFMYTGLDTSVKDLARAHFLSSDSKVWYNQNVVSYHFEPPKDKPRECSEVTKTIVKDKAGKKTEIEDDKYASDFLNKLSRMIVTDDSIIRILRKNWSSGKIRKGERNNKAMSYAGILCKAGIDEDRTKELLEELIPGFDVTQIIDYAYTNNVFGCERRKYK